MVLTSKIARIENDGKSPFLIVDTSEAVIDVIKRRCVLVKKVPAMARLSELKGMEIDFGTMGYGQNC